jgi:hypothetical protein
MISYEDLQGNDQATLDETDIGCCIGEFENLKKAINAIDTISMTLVMLAHAKGSKETRVFLPDGVLINNFVSDNRVIIGLAASLDLISHTVELAEDFMSTIVLQGVKSHREKQETKP